MRRTDRSDTELVAAARGEDGEAFGELFDRWFNSSWNVARTIVRNDELAADVAQDALLAAWQRLDQLENADAFGGWLLRITRNRALNRLERENRSRASGDDVVSGLRDQGLPDPTGAERPLGPDSISEVRDRQELVWAAAAALGEREVSLLDLHLRHGLSPAEIADELGVEANNAHQQLFRLRNRLGDAIGSYLLWRNGRPLCDGLAAAVGGDVAFDRSVARAVSKHQASCEHCSERRAGLIDPSKLFAGVPLVLVPTQLKVQAAAALQSAGVPLGSGAGSADPGTQLEPNAGGDSAGSIDGGAPVEGAGAQGGPVSGGSVDDGPSVLAEHAKTDEPVTVSQSPLRRRVADSTGRRVIDGLTTAKAGGILLAVAVLLMAAVAVPRALSGGGETLAAIDSQVTEAEEAPAARSAETAERSTGETEPDRFGPDRFAPAAPAAGDDEQASTSNPVPSTSDPGSTSTPRSSTTTDAGSTPTTPSTTRSTTETTPTTAATPNPDPGPPDPDPPTPDPPAPDPDPPTPDPPDPDPPAPDPDPPTPDPDPPAPDPVEQPEIIRFAANRPPGVLLCPNPDQGPFEAFWSTKHADGVTLSLPNGTHQGGPSGSHRFCGSSGDTIRLLATGPGGEDKSSTRL